MLTPSGSSLRFVVGYAAILDSILGVCSIVVDCFVSSTSYAVAIGMYLANFTEPNENALNIHIRFTVLPYVNSAVWIRNVLVDLISKRWA